MRSAQLSPASSGGPWKAAGGQPRKLGPTDAPGQLRGTQGSKATQRYGRMQRGCVHAWPGGRVPSAQGTAHRGRVGGPAWLRPGKAGYHVSWTQVRVIAAQPRVGKGHAQVSDLGREVG